VVPVVPAAGDPAVLAEVPDAVPLTVVEVGRGGRWLVACAARSDTDRNGNLRVTVGTHGALGGDALVPELVLGGAAPQPIDDFLGFDPQGRYVVVKTGQTISLIDTATRAAVDLGALRFDARDDVLDHRQHRALAFDPRGEILAYLRKSEPPALVLRTLASGEERVVGELGGEPYRLAWDGTGETLVVTVITLDTTNDGRLTFPVRLASRPRLRCDGPIPRFQLSSENGDRPTSVLVRRDGTLGPKLADLALPFGTAVIRRSVDGVLTLERGSERVALTKADCGARVLDAEPELGLLLVACAGGKVPQKAEVELVGAGYRKSLGLTVQPIAIDRWPEPPSRLHALYPGTDTVLVDLKERRTILLKPGDRVLAILGTRAFVRRDKALQVIDAERQAERTLLTGIPRASRELVALPLAVIGTELLNLDTEQRLGALGGRPLAITTKGDALVADGASDSADSLSLGPLRWHRPLPAKP